MARFGRIDVLVNNAGYGVLGAVEETSIAEAKANFDTNVFGMLAVTQAVLPQMRQQRSGHVINISSLGGYSAYHGWGVYGASEVRGGGADRSQRPRNWPRWASTPRWWSRAFSARTS